ncbi:DUF1657 domain-containing protein [Halalkalibacter hemicellulosilyticus]|uniref:DUF1657 domain-containing protein n=1 Tax=Halalkalibacter hemicellulosilyticusJCM 9152 TaxID=1236971 RepID=W4QAH1_9BACI|nr:DUF1657 domain-containing protein [Halalkalibacter hemicellulosilyticus]GAE28952.1 hypothetical protein JCM9152_290 [Halalkalibacter hemicellulosilyticusJCM 9152]
MTVASKVESALVSLKAIEASLLSLSLKTKEQEASEAFRQAALKTRTVVDEVQKRKQEIEFQEPQYEPQ